MVTNRLLVLWRRRVLIGAAGLVVLGYFAWHAFHGNHGLVARDGLTERVAVLEAEVARVREERRALERRVALLKPQSLDPDMLEERARETLMLSHQNDVVLVSRPAAPTPTQSASPRR
jgi:cell division protein FtsB